MPKPIRPARKRTLTRFLALPVPIALRRPVGRHRDGRAPAAVARRRLVIRAVVPPPLSAPLRPEAQPRLRRGQWIGAGVGLRIPAALPPRSLRVRPYLLAHEQWTRRAALALALDGVDIGPWVIHGHRVGTPVGVPVTSPEAVGVAA